jgi:preprotein translocase subunit YajC
MIVTPAHAASDIEVPGTTSGTSMPPPETPPSAGQAFMTNMGMVVLLMVLFYFLLIKPQQRRFREHSQMLSGLKKGDRVITGGGLIGTIDKIGDSDEAVIDLGNGLKVTALRSTIQSKDDPRLRKKAANDEKAGKDEKKN